MRCGVAHSLHRRRLRFWIADLLQVRMFLEFWLYLRVWSRKRGKRWLNHHFRSAIGFESFFVEMPSLVVQIYVLIEDPRPGTSTQAFAFIMTVCSAFIVLLHYFKYLHVTASVYGVMMTKVGQPCFRGAWTAPIAACSAACPLAVASDLCVCFRSVAQAVFSSALRTVLIALLINYLRTRYFSPHHAMHHRHVKTLCAIVRVFCAQVLRLCISSSCRGCSAWLCTISASATRAATGATTRCTSSGATPPSGTSSP
jgi:hypothetical protein